MSFFKFDAVVNQIASFYEESEKKPWMSSLSVGREGTGGEGPIHREDKAKSTREDIVYSSAHLQGRGWT